MAMGTGSHSTINHVQPAAAHLAPHDEFLAQCDADLQADALPANFSHPTTETTFDAT